MIKEAFLICALALPKEPIADRYAKLKAFLTLNKDQEVYLGIDESAPDGKGWERVPFLWEDYRIWVRRSA